MFLRKVGNRLPSGAVMLQKTRIPNLHHFTIKTPSIPEIPSPPQCSSFSVEIQQMARSAELAAPQTTYGHEHSNSLENN
jgi:hypothetical protein